MRAASKPLTGLIFSALLAAAPSSAQIPIAGDSAALPVAPEQGNAGPGGAADGPDVSPQGDLLSGLESGTSGRSWFSRLKGWLGVGGAPARQGGQAYAAGDYDLALQKFAEAQLDQPESQALAYNAGNAQFRKKKYDEAIVSYKKALHGDDAGLAASAYYNMGNAHFRKGEFAVQAGKQEGIEDYRAAMADYKKSLEIRPDNKDAKRNIEVVQARIKELLERQQQDQQNQQGNPQKPPEPSEEAKRVLARAMQLVAERRYAEAKALLEDIIQRDRTAASYQSHVQRIDDVLKILRGEAPAAPVPQDPRSQQPGVGDMIIRSHLALRRASAALLLAGILSVAATARTAQDYFHGAAGKYVGARHQEALIEVEEGLRRHPDDQALKSLKTQLERLKDQQRQDQGSQGSSGGEQGDQKQDKQEGSQDQGGSEEKEKEEEKKEEQSGKQDEGKEDEGKGASQGEEEQKKDDPESPEQAAAPVKPGEMSKEDAERLLNSIQDDEKREHRNMQRRHRDKVRVEQDW